MHPGYERKPNPKPPTPAIDEHIFAPLSGGTQIKCSCGKIFGITDEANQHWAWHMNLAKSTNRKFYAEELLGLPIIQDEKEITHADPTDPNSVKEIYTIHIRNKVKAELRQAIKDKWLAGDV